MAYIAINGYELPPPKRGVAPIVTTIVDAGRDANGTVVGQRIGRDQYKLNELEWPWLTAAQYVTFPDPVTNSRITIKMYPGDRTGEPYYVDGNENPTHYRNCRVNLIDVGE